MAAKTRITVFSVANGEALQAFGPDLPDGQVVEWNIEQGVLRAQIRPLSGPLWRFRTNLPFLVTEKPDAVLLTPPEIQ